MKEQYHGYMLPTSFSRLFHPAYSLEILLISHTRFWAYFPAALLTMAGAASTDELYARFRQLEEAGKKLGYAGSGTVHDYSSNCEPEDIDLYVHLTS